MPYGVIYGLYDPSTDELRYIGQTTRDLKLRLWGHLSETRKRICLNSCRFVTTWIASLIKQRLVPKINVICVAENRTELDNLEIQNIAEAKLKGIKLLNQTSGGGGKSGQKLSEEHYKKLHNPEVWAKIAATKKGKPSPRKGRTHTLETIKKIRANTIGKQAGERHPLFRHDVSTDFLIERIKDGLSTSKIGIEVGMGRHAVLARVRKARAAGISVPITSAKETPNELILQKIKEGFTKKQIAKDLRLSECTVYKRVKKLKQEGKIISNSVSIEEILNKIKDGLSIKQAAQELGLTKDCVYWRIRKYKDRTGIPRIRKNNNG